MMISPALASAEYRRVRMTNNTSALPSETHKKVIVLIGAAHGIGKAIALMAAQRGFALAACDIDETGLQALKAELPATSEALLLPADVTSAESVNRFIRATLERFERIDSVICNAGGMISLVHEGKVSSNIRRFQEMPSDDWVKIVNLNFYGALNVAHAVLPPMLEQGHGRLTFVASVAGLVGSPGLSVYAAAKGGVIAFAKSLAREVGENGIAVNCVAPGAIATRAFPQGSPSVQKRLERVPLKRLGQPEEVADVVIYMAADAPSYLTGEVVSVSGGPA
ncbi:MAG: SDR family NAD(P)-dependent oxidoreductase [Pigmentiphaga sp.]